MSNYTKTTNFAAKDSLPSGNAAKIVKGAEIDTEFNNIATASATKANANNAALTGTTVFETLSDGTIGVTGWVDEDNMSSDSAVLIPTQQSVKAYVDSQVTAQDLDVTDGTTSIDIDLDSESLGILGGTGLTSTASGTGVTLAIDSTVTTLTGTQTLTNKTLTTPTILTSFTIGSATITEAELEILDGATVTTAELNVLDGITSTTAELNILDGVTSTASELNILDGVTSTATELNILDGVTATTAEINYVDGVTSNVQTQINTKAPIDGATFTGTTTIPTADINGGAIDGTVIGGSTAAAVSATTVSASGNITVGGTVDGRDVATDGTKLDGIEASADVTDTANVTSAGALMDSELTAIASVKALNQGVATSDSPSFTNLTLSGTGSVKVPAGTTAQRDGSPAAGMFRYNSSLEQFEGYTSEWGSIGGGGGTNTFTTDSFTGNGSTTAYALSQVTSSEDNLLVFIEGVFQQQDAYSIATASGTTTLTFSAAPANGNAILIYSVASAVSGSNLNIDSMTGDGSDVTLTLSISPVNENNTQVFIDGVYQSKSNYSISGTTLTFSTAPPTGSAVEVMTFTQTDINVPVDGTITSAKLSGDLTTPGALTVTGTATAGSLLTTGAIASTAVDGTVVDRSGNTSRFVAGRSGGNYAGLEMHVAGASGVTKRFSIDYDSTTKLFAPNGTSEHLVVTSAGLVGIGCTPTQEVEIKAASVPTLKLNQAGTYGAEIALRGNDLDIAGSANDIVFYTGGNNDVSTTERMRIDSSGNLLVGKTTNVYSGVVEVQQTAGGAVSAAITCSHASQPYGLLLNFTAASPDNNTNYFMTGADSTANRFFIYSDGDVWTSDAGTLTSDERLKTNVQDATPKLDDLLALRVRNFEWIPEYHPNKVGEKKIGFIAQEFEQTFPALVSENTFELNGEEVTRKSVRMGALIPVLVKAIQEQQALIESQATAITDLTTRLTALENN